MKEVKKREGGIGIRGENFSPERAREQLDRQMFELSFPVGEGKVSSVFPANRESFIRKMAGLKLVEKRKVKNLSPRIVRVVRVTANSIKS